MRESSRRALRLARWLVPCAALLAAEPAGAYCRTRTCEFRRRTPCNVDSLTGCSLDGPFVFWPDGCIPFAVQRDGSALDGLSAATLEAIVEDGLRVWSEVPCLGGTSPVLSAASQGPVACDAVEYDCTEREANSNVVMFRDDFLDENPGLHFGIIALTTLTANTRTGELFDADMEINTRDEDFVLEGGGSGIQEGQARDLRGVVIHELGHLLGLSHSRELGALMRESYEGTVDPASDDIAGICAALDTAREDPICDIAPLGADAGCVGHDVSCTSSQPARGERGPDGCACELAGPGSGRPAPWHSAPWHSAPWHSAPWHSAPWHSGVPVAGAAGALLFRHLRRSRRSRSVL